ncbi:MAG: tetraacyldisaccharide 4'-kinase, partial [Pirellulales bacterium]|nr:tetraacyldisaccharide 4'-kinase [Pirellulales bacterium]
MKKLLNPGSFRDLVGGRRRGPGASLLRGALRTAEPCYAAAARLRNWMYDAGVKKVHKVDAPVVSVGNITLGGTGKTPMVRRLARWFIARGVRAAVVSRGYGSAAGQMNDEALEMRMLLPEVPHLQNPDRVAAAREAIEKLDAQLIILDDGFQHRRIARDLDIVLLDALNPFGFDRVFPRGLLREPLSGLRRADAVVLSHADLIEPSERESIWRVVRRRAPEAVFAEAAHVPRMLISRVGKGDSPHLCEAPEGPFRQMGTV